MITIIILVICYLDANWAESLSGKTSTFGYCVHIDDNSIF